VETLADKLLKLLEPADVREGKYLVELSGGVLLVWRISPGEPADEALDPVPDWTLLPA
jgi:hypothetical protein